jgi:hypothetical protein
LGHPAGRLEVMAGRSCGLEIRRLAGRLLDSEPALRWQVERDLVDAPGGLGELRARGGRAGARLLARQGVDGIRRVLKERRTAERMRGTVGGVRGGALLEWEVDVGSNSWTLVGRGVGLGLDPASGSGCAGCFVAVGGAGFAYGGGEVVADCAWGEGGAAGYFVDWGAFQGQF